MEISFKTLLAFFAGLVFVSQAWSMPEGLNQILNEKESAAVAAGKLVVRTVSIDDEYGTRVEAFQIVKAPAKHILALISDFERLPEFTPNLDAIEVLKEDGNGAVVNYTLGLPFGVVKKYRLALEYNKEAPALSMSWQSVPWEDIKAEDTIESTTGIWLLKPLSNPEQSMLIYFTETRPGQVPFGLGWVVEYLTQQSIVDLINSTKEKAEEQWQAQK